MAVYMIEVQGWRPATLNELMESVGARIRLKKRDRKWVGDFCKVLNRVPDATCKRRVFLLLRFEPGERRPDPDAWHKSLLDALKWHHLLIDDGPKWCEVMPVVYDGDRKPGGKATLITLEDLEPEC